MLNLGQIYRVEGDTQKGIEYYHEAIDLSEKTGDLYTYSMAMANLANCYFDIGRISEAEKLFQNNFFVPEITCVFTSKSRIY